VKKQPVTPPTVRKAQAPAPASPAQVRASLVLCPGPKGIER
jgi:hypothetical protein